MMTFVFDPNCFYIMREIPGKRKLFNSFFLLLVYSIPGLKTITGKKGGGIFSFQGELTSKYPMGPETIDLTVPEIFIYF